MAGQAENTENKLFAQPCREAHTMLNQAIRLYSGHASAFFILTASNAVALKVLLCSLSYEKAEDINPDYPVNPV
jgi:hypothetical protein